MGILGFNVEQQFRRDTAAAWTEKNPILSEGEPGLELDTGKMKMGDGVSAWNTLPYFMSDKANADLSNVEDDVFIAKANQAGIGGGSVSSVNGVEQVEGNITLTAADIPYSNGESIQQAVSKILNGETDIPSAYFSITVENPDRGGIITVDKTRAKMNEQITVTVIPETGYALDAKTLKQNDTVIVDNKFIMPNCNVIIKGVFDDNNLIYTLSADGTYYSVKQKSNTSPANQIQAYRDGKPVKVIEPYGFYGNTATSYIDLPNTIEKISDFAFAECKVFEVKWSKNLKEIGNNAFYNSYIQSFYLPPNVEIIREGALNSRKNYICEIPNSVTDFDTRAFGDSASIYFDQLIIDLSNIPSGIKVTSLATLIVGSNVKKISDNAFKELNPPRIKLEIKEGVEYIGSQAFGKTGTNYTRLGEIIIPSSVMTIASKAFNNYAEKFIIKGKSSIPSTWATDWYYSGSPKPIIEFQP